MRIVHAYGLAHQAPSFAVPVPVLTPSLEEGLQESLQASAGVELDYDRATSASGSAFYNAFFDMTDAIGSNREDGPPDFDERSDGYAVGLELHLERRLSERVGAFSDVHAVAVRAPRGRRGVRGFLRSHARRQRRAYPACTTVTLSGEEELTLSLVALPSELLRPSPSSEELLFEPYVAADVDGDHDVTLEELELVPLETTSTNPFETLAERLYLHLAPASEPVPVVAGE